MEQKGEPGKRKGQHVIIFLVLVSLAVGMSKILSDESNKKGNSYPGPEESQESELEQESFSVEQKVLKALQKLLQDSMTQGDVNACRSDLFSGLNLMDWKVYEALGEECDETGAVAKLFNWIEAQTAYTYDEILSLQRIHTSNLDEAYTDMYAHLLCDVFLKEPAGFFACLDHSPRDGQRSEKVISMTVGAAKSIEKEGRIEELTKDLIESKTLSEGAVIWAGLMRENCCVYTQASQPKKETASIPVLLYHHLLPRVEIADNQNGMTVPVEEFRCQMAWLKEKGYKTPTLSQFFAWLKGEIELPEKSVLITFDDNYHSIKDYALPILEENCLTAVSFVIGICTGEPRGATGHVSWGDMVSIQNAGTIDFQSHTYDGHTETLGEPDILWWPSEQFNDDLKRLEDHFVAHNLAKPWVFAYPYGAVNHVLTEVLASRGYQLAFTTEHGFVAKGDDLLRLKRIIIWPGTTPEQFQALMEHHEG